MRRLTTEDFITKAKNHVVHAAAGYDYSRVFYLGSDQAVKIGCRTHGYFQQIPETHLAGSGCPRCWGERKGRAVARRAAEIFINKASAEHGAGAYDYSHVVYLNNHIKVEIRCPTHGLFWQTPMDHLAGRGCAKCAGFISKIGTAWLNGLGIEGLIHEWRIPGTRFRADGYDPATNTVYEFHGTRWHGWMAPGRPDRYNTKTRCMMSELYTRTLTKEAHIRTLGYRLVVMWQHEWVMRLWLVDKGFIQHPLEGCVSHPEYAYATEEAA